MKTVILAGGLGTRLSEETRFVPKPMVQIGGYPMLWHIMNIYSKHGFNDFVICAGYKQEVIFEWAEKNKDLLDQWNIEIVDTGLNTMTGGRIKRIQPYIGNEDFMLTYGDGLSDINIKDLLKYHYNRNRTLTITAYLPENRFGILKFDENDNVLSFSEKTRDDSDWINAGFMVCSPEVFDYLEGDATVFEKEPMQRIAQSGCMAAYKHHGYWQCMDTLREKQILEELWKKGDAPWKL
ncbi:MAG: glucose-1-phosphate cytidylyltransferase [Erysipelotrichaceae bacterium]|nr:glucose-1-phosphate cytidylyltransferase [Erysipelotrichaceae bacterium]